MDQTLSLYLIETIPLLEAESETYALDLVTLVESILENPDAILRRQLDKLKGRAIAEMKAAGLDYDQRMEELEKLEHPKPLRDFVYTTFNEFADRHPWVGEENIHPKSIARELYEKCATFNDYVHALERWAVFLVYLPAVAMVLRRPNVSEPLMQNAAPARTGSLRGWVEALPRPDALLLLAAAFSALFLVWLTLATPQP